MPVKAAPWPALKIELWPLRKVRAYPKNPRTHSPEQIDKLVASYKQFGWTIPMLVDERGEIIAGHGREAMAAKVGLKEVPVVVAKGWSDEQKRAYRIADNQLAIFGSDWNLDLLKGELAQLNGTGFDLLLTGFTEQQLLELDGRDPDTDPEATPEPPKPPIVRKGDLWVLGKHRLLCGDATVKADVAKCLGEAAPHLMVTDPPYGVDYDPDWRNRADRANGKPYGARAIGLVANDTRSDWSEAYSLFPGDVIYVWHPAGAKSVDFFNSLESSAFEFRMQIIWNKSTFPIGRGNYHVKHEPCWYGVRKGKTAHWSGNRTQTTVWDIPKPQKSETGHSTQKPVECMKRPMENNAKVGDWVYDPFVGSGTSIIAAEMTKRRCCAIDIDPTYVEVAIERWQTFAKGKATLEGDNRDFEIIKRERLRSAKGPSGKSVGGIRSNPRADEKRRPRVDTKAAAAKP